MKSIIRELCPPVIWKGLSRLKNGKSEVAKSKPVAELVKSRNENPDKQDLDLYWDPNYAKVLEEWGKDNTWNEIQLIFADRSGKVLDIACGTGATIKLLDKNPKLEVHGFDISDLLIQKAKEKNIPADRLHVEDATKTNYKDNEFDYSYSIGSLEHFTDEGIDQFIGESSRYTRSAAFHMIPVSRSETDEGWLKTLQSFFNNSESWWMKRFQKHFTYVYSVPSKWEDDISFGRWFICIK